MKGWLPFLNCYKEGLVVAFSVENHYLRFRECYYLVLYGELVNGEEVWLYRRE